MNEIQNEIIKTSNVAEAMNKYASDNLTPLAECDFTINSVTTYVRDTSQKEFILVDKETLKHYLDRDKIVNTHIEFHQIYTITAQKRTNPHLLLNYLVQMGEQSSHPQIIIGANSKINYKKLSQQDMLVLLYKEMNKIKALNNILINIFDEEMKTKLRSFVKYLYAGKFTKKVKLPLFEGISPVITRNSKFIYWFKEKIHVNQVIEVEANEVLIEFKKPIFGRNGLSAHGLSIDAQASNNSANEEVIIDEKSIKIEENQDSKKYLSKNKGFVHFVNHHLSIDNRIKVSELSRNNTSIASEEDNNIEVLISQNDTNKDSIGEGVDLVSERIHVNGHVGANSKLEATNLQIDGATHKDSTQIAKTAIINRHKGTLRCQKAKIALLEGGEVHATTVDIEACLGGSIFARDVVIGHVKSNLKVYASNSIKINLVSGEDNLFKISYKDIPILRSKIKFIDSDLDDLKFDLEEASRHAKEKVGNIKSEIEILKNERLSIVKSYEDATITIEKPLRGLNSIIFAINDDNEIVFKTNAEQYSTFELEVDENKITLLPVNKTITLS